MALISNGEGRREDETASGYERLFGNKQLGKLISKIQSAVISTGIELENILANRLRNTDGISIAKVNKPNRVFKEAKHGHDLIIDCVISNDKEYKLIEIKDGDTFDTKKVAGELESLELAKQFLINKRVPSDKISKHLCSFNAINHEQIEKGSKGLLDRDMAMTGKELCDLLDLNFDEIVEERKSQQEENFNYFIDELIKIPKIKTKLNL